MTRSTYNNGVGESRVYNADSTLSSISYSGAAMGDVSYGWDDNKNKTGQLADELGHGQSAQHGGREQQ